MRHHLCFVVTAGLLAAASFLPAQVQAADVAVLDSRAIVVARGATYAWAPTITTADPRLDNSIVDERLRLATDRALAARGLRRVSDPAAAQFLVSYQVALQDRSEAHVRSVGMAPVAACGPRGCVRGWTSYGTRVEVDEITQGYMALSLFERRTGQLAWRATSTKRVTAKDASQSTLDRAMATLTRSLPEM